MTAQTCCVTHPGAHVHGCVAAIGHEGPCKWPAPPLTSAEALIHDLERLGATVVWLDVENPPGWGPTDAA